MNTFQQKVPLVQHEGLGHTTQSGKRMKNFFFCTTLTSSLKWCQRGGLLTLAMYMISVRTYRNISSHNNRFHATGCAGA